MTSILSENVIRAETTHTFFPVTLLWYPTWNTPKILQSTEGSPRKSTFAMYSK